MNLHYRAAYNSELIALRANRIKRTYRRRGRPTQEQPGSQGQDPEYPQERGKHQSTQGSGRQPACRRQTTPAARREPRGPEPERTGMSSDSCVYTEKCTPRNSLLANMDGMCRATYRGEVVKRSSEALCLASELVGEGNVLDGGDERLGTIHNRAVQSHLRAEVASGAGRNSRAAEASRADNRCCRGESIGCRHHNAQGSKSSFAQPHHR